jgi:hypothetical protein
MTNEKMNQGECFRVPEFEFVMLGRIGMIYFWQQDMVASYICLALLAVLGIPAGVAM